MSKLTKSVAYARALGRELQGARAGLVRFAPRLGLEIREVNANIFDGVLVRAREFPCGVILIRKSIREPPGNILRWPKNSVTISFPITITPNSLARSRTSETGVMDR